MAIPKQGDTVVRATDGKRFTVDQVVEAGGEDLYRVSGDGEKHELSGAAFVKEHEEARPAFQVQE